MPYYDMYGLDYYLCFPYKDALQEYEEKFINCSNTKEYIDKVIRSYDRRYEQFMNNSHKEIILSKGETLEDALLRMNIKLISKNNIK